MIVYLPQPVATAKAEGASAPRGLGERRKIHYNVKDFSRRAISVRTANRLARRRVKAILSEVMCFIEFVAKQP